MDNQIKILVTGDFYGGNRIEKLIINKQYSTIFGELLTLIKDNDIAITNLESPLTTSTIPISKTGPALKALPDTIEALKYAGFNLLTLANNHIMDYGVEGLVDTLNLCKARNIDTLGAGLNLQESSQTYFKDIKGKVLAFINFTENEWSTTQGQEPGANPLNPIQNFRKIHEAREKADYVFVIVHGGHENYQLPSPNVKQTYRFFVDAGADAVIGHHTHCYSGIEIYKKCPIFYSLGNFVFDSFNEKRNSWDIGFAVKFILTNKELKYEILPYKQYKTDPAIRYLDDNETSHFSTELLRLQEIIANDTLLAIEFDKYVSKVSREYLSYMEPFTNKYLNALRKRSLFPSLLSRKKRLLYLNLIRSEAHRDIITKLLK